MRRLLVVAALVAVASASCSGAGPLVVGVPGGRGVTDLYYWESNAVRNREGWLMLAYHLRHEHSWGLRRLARHLGKQERQVARMLAALEADLGADA